ncbi:pinin/SDK/memA/ protein conserved region [Microdochium nivale]|nr:pinin/SDK/memA/ protein conserved region [Microdochium nivale]
MMESPKRPPSQSSAAPRHVDDNSDDTHKRKLDPKASYASGSSRSPKRSRRDNGSRASPSDPLPPANGDARSPPPSSARGADRARPTTTTTSRADALQEEKRRGKRLFGGLLSTLGGRAAATPSAHQKRRQDIERQQQERAHQQRAVDDKVRGERLAKLKKLRETEQINFDEQVLKTRHDDLLAKARFLRTKSDPSIYYLPWRPTEAQQELIQKQVRDTDELIRREQDDSARCKQNRTRELGIWREPSRPEASVGNTGDGKGEHDEDMTDSVLEDAEAATSSVTGTRGHAVAALSPSLAAPGTRTTATREEEAEEAEAGDIMVEEAEDTVIY